MVSTVYSGCFYGILFLDKNHCHELPGLYTSDHQVMVGLVGLIHTKAWHLWTYLCADISLCRIILLPVNFHFCAQILSPKGCWCDKLQTTTSAMYSCCGVALWTLSVKKSVKQCIQLYTSACLYALLERHVQNLQNVVLEMAITPESTIAQSSLFMFDYFCLFHELEKCWHRKRIQ